MVVIYKLIISFGTFYIKQKMSDKDQKTVHYMVCDIIADLNVSKKTDHDHLKFFLFKGSGKERQK